MSEYIRKCWNIQSRAHPDIGCKRSANHTEFCNLHYKHPRYYSKPVIIDEFTNQQQAILRRFINSTKIKIGLKKYRIQGPATVTTGIATNDTEVASLEPLNTIPQIFRFSCISGKQIWLFDIRTLLQEKKMSSLKNPYTGEVFSEVILARFQAHYNWLKSRKYYLEIASGNEIVISEYSYRQKILELALFIDTHGYLTNTAWFEEMTLSSIWTFCRKLNYLWLFGLNLTDDERARIIPTWTAANYSLFSIQRIHTRSISSAIERVCECLLTFVKASPDKANRTLACMYVLMALCEINESCRETYPWLASD